MWLVPTDLVGLPESIPQYLLERHPTMDFRRAVLYCVILPGHTVALNNEMEED